MVFCHVRVSCFAKIVPGHRRSCRFWSQHCSSLAWHWSINMPCMLQTLECSAPLARYAVPATGHGRMSITAASTPNPHTTHHTPQTMRLKMPGRTQLYCGAHGSVMQAAQWRLATKVAARGRSLQEGRGRIKDHDTPIARR